MRSILGRRLAAVAGGTAITAMVVFTASCAKEEEKAPEETTTTTTTTHHGPATGGSRRADREGTAPGARCAQPLLADRDRTARTDGNPGSSQLSTALFSVAERGRRQSIDSAATANDATWPIAMFNAACMSRGSRPVCDSR